ncbi:MAG: hypothetical protein KBG07_07225, partial [Elusimicrobia bacterium]|nr:hypothetical protein [Elusimicrobiota bacterium]
GYLGSFVLGWVGSYFLHSSMQQVKTHNADKWVKNIDGSERSGRTDTVTFKHDVGSFVLKWAMETERFLALGDTDRARTSFESLTIYSKDMNAPLLQSYVAGLDKRMREMEEHPMTDESRAVSLLLELMEESLNDGDWSAMFSAGDFLEEKMGSATSEQKELVKLWDDILDFLDGLTYSLQETDAMALTLGETGRNLLAQEGIFRPYHEKILFHVLKSYWIWRENGGTLTFSNVNHEPTLARIIKKHPSLDMDIGDLSDIVGKYVEGHKRSGIFKFLLGNGMEVRQAFMFLFEIDVNTRFNNLKSSNQKGIVLTDMAVLLPGVLASVSVIGLIFVKGFTDPSFIFPSLFAMTAVGLIVVGVIGVVVIHVSVRFRDFLERKKSAAREFAVVLKTAQEEGDSAHRLSLDVAGQDLVRKVSSEEGVWLNRYLKEAMATMGVAPLSFAAARALISVKGWGAQVYEISAGVMPDAGGSHPLVIVYLNNDMASGGVADLVQRYSPGGEGVVVFVPTDAVARAAVLSLPDTFGGLIFDGGTGRADRVPSLAAVERRLEIAGLNFSQYTGCRVVTPVGMALDAQGVRSDLFRDALIVLLNGLTGIVLKREHLRSIDRAARAVVSAA